MGVKNIVYVLTKAAPSDLILYSICKIIRGLLSA